MLTMKSAVLLCCALLGVSSAASQSVAFEKAAEGCGRQPNLNLRQCGTHFVSCHDLKNPNERQCRNRRPSRHHTSSFCEGSSSSSSSSSCSNRNHRPRHSSSSSCSEVAPSPAPIAESCSSSESSSCSSSSSSHHHHHPAHCSQLDVNGGWYKFRFGKTGSTVHKCYDFVTVGPAVLRIAGLDCSGDAFSVYDNGNLILQTPLVNGDNCHQANTLVSPHKAYESENYSHGRVNLAPGAHSIKIVVARSPQKHGVGALRVDSVMAQCPKELNGLKVVNTPVPFSKAAGVCKAIGMQLADLDIYNFLDATTLAFECSGAFSATWIKSYFKGTPGVKGLALYTGAAAPGGSINIPASLEEHLPVLCQVIPVDDKPAPCTESSSSSENCSYANHHHVCHECSSSSSSSCSGEVAPVESSCSEEEQSSSLSCSSSSSSSACSNHRRRHHRN